MVPSSQVCGLFWVVIWGVREMHSFTSFPLPSLSLAPHPTSMTASTITQTPDPPIWQQRMGVQATTTVPSFTPCPSELSHYLR